MGTAFLYGNGGSGGTGATLTVTAPSATNLITFPSDNIPNGVTREGITFTATDGYYEFNGTATDYLWLQVLYFGADAPFDLNAEYSLSGAPEGSSMDTFRLAVTNGLGAWEYDEGSGVTFQFSEIEEGPARAEIQIYKGATLDHVVFRPKLVKRNATVVTVSKDGKTKTKVAGADGVAVFKGLSSGDWLLSITDGTQAAQKTVTITADYATAITFFAATIHVTYPAGSTCTATDGVTTLPAPDTSGTWACVVPNAGAWTVTATDGTHTESRVAEVAETGQVVSVALAYGMVYDSGTLFVPYTHMYGGSVKQNADHILMTTPAANADNGSCGILFDKRDLSNYSKAELVYGGMQSGCTMGFRIVDSDPNNIIVKTNSTSKSGTLSLDLTSVTGMYNVYVLLYNNEYARTAKVMRVVLS